MQRGTWTLDQRLAHCSGKVQRINILGFEGCESVATIEVRCCSVKAVIDDMQIDELPVFQRNFIFKNKRQILFLVIDPCIRATGAQGPQETILGEDVELGSKQEWEEQF
jgi:hypothetical protein